ncbi:Tc toxin subunit A [Xanthomonas sp. WHRI 1810A]|uniref:Tc toxin subunit A n=1 Tax=Xanthomonas sp. WHRI 1810A TaxID=3161565 RepID=UPI0032E8E915
MKKIVKNSAKSVSALDMLLGNTRQTKAGISALTQQFSSVLSLSQADIPRLMKQNPQMHITEARDIHARAQAMSVVIARQFREQRLTASVRQANRPLSGIKGLVDGPTYTDMFNPDWANHCPPDAIEATTSPVAYLADLYRFALELEASGDQSAIISLDARRPDLKDLLLDHTALNRVEPTIVLVNEILESSIRGYLDGIALEDKPVDDALLEARYPNALPFERYTSQINYALGRKNYTLGDAIRAADPDYPYFKEPGVHSLLSDIALIQDTGLGPVQQGLLLEAPYFPQDGATAHPLSSSRGRIDPRTRLLSDETDPGTPTTFYLDNFGVGGFVDLQDTQTFCLRTGLTTEELEALLSVGAFATTRSSNITEGAGQAVDGSLSGSVYINAGALPAMGIETLPAQDGGPGPSHRLTGSSPDRFDRMNRMIRLSRWLELPFHEVDLLLVASLQAEQQASTVTRRVKAGDSNPYHITQNTLRSLGLFQIVRKRFGATAEDFAALLYGLGVYGRGKTASQFDRVFNGQALFEVPLILDDQPFSIIPENEAERQKINHLCAALGMTYEVFRYVARVVQQTYAGESLRWSREVVSAFYRLVKLPRYLGLNTVEVLALLELLDDGGSHLVSKLAGVTQIATHYGSDNTDTLSVLHALVDFSVWLKDNKWTVAQLCKLVMPPVTQPIATDAEHALLQQMHSRLTAALITDSSFAQVGAPDVSVTMQRDEQGKEVYTGESIDWFEALRDFIDNGNTAPGAKGLVKHLDGETEETFESALSSQIKSACDNYGLAVEELHPKLTNMIMRARGAQEALLMEGLGSYLNTSADLAKALVIWTKGDRYTLLLEVVRVYGTALFANVPIGDEVLLVLEALVKRAAVSSHLGLSSALVIQLAEHPDWFGLVSTELSLQMVYFLTQYAMTLRLSEQNEDTVLDYFRLINTVWAGSTDGDKRLIRDSAANRLAGFLRWGVREVLASAVHIEPEAGVIFTLREFDTAVRIALLSRDTHLDAKALLALHLLTPTSATELYRQAAELALSCLTESPQGSSAEEVGQSLSSVITVTPDYLVANRPGDSATYTITLRDFMDEPFEAITVHWRTDLGELDQVQTTTDEKGISSTTISSGSIMGVANVVASYGLGEILKAPVLVIDCEEESLHFVNPAREPSVASANNIGTITFDIELLDDLGNAGVDREIIWGTTHGEFKRYQTFTNSLGVGTAMLQSRKKGIATVRAEYGNGSYNEFQSVEFVSIPYFQFVRFSSFVVVDVEAEVVCRLVEIDGSPVATDTQVFWSSSDASASLTEVSNTDLEGYAKATFKVSAVGTVTVTVASPSAVEEKSTAQVEIFERATISQSYLSAEYYILGSSDPVVFSVVIAGGGQDLSAVPVVWKSGDVEVETKTDRQGLANFSSVFSEGEHVVVAAIPGGETVEFQVTGVPFFNFVTELSGKYVEADGIECPGLLSYCSSYSLNVKLIDGSGKAIAGVPFALKSGADDPTLIGCDIEDLGVRVLSSVDGHDFSIITDPWSKGLYDLVLKLGTGPVELGINYKLGEIHRLFVRQSVSEDNLSVYHVGEYLLGNSVQHHTAKAPPWFAERDVEFVVPSKELRKTVLVYWQSCPRWDFYIDIDGSPEVGDDYDVTRFFSNDGYLYWSKVPGEKIN